MKRCVICNRLFNGFGNNPEPVRRWIEGSCCDFCNISVVVPARLGKKMETPSNV